MSSAGKRRNSESAAPYTVANEQAPSSFLNLVIAAGVVALVVLSVMTVKVARIFFYVAVPWKWNDLLLTQRATRLSTLVSPEIYKLSPKIYT